MRRLFPLLLLTCALLLCGCSAEPETPAAACFADDTAGQWVRHSVGGQDTLLRVAGADAAALRTWAETLPASAREYGEGASPGDAEGGEVYDIAPDGGAGFSYVVGGTGGAHLLIGEVWYEVTEPSPPPLPTPDGLTLTQVCALAEKGDALTWDDFSGVEGEDVGSGLYLMRYEVETGYVLLVGGVPTERPMYVRLARAEEPEDFVEIRTGDVRAFLGLER